MKYTFADDENRNQAAARFLKRWLGLESIDYNLADIFITLSKDDTLSQDFRNLAELICVRIEENYRPEWYTPEQAIRNKSEKSGGPDFSVPNSVILEDALRESSLFTDYMEAMLRSGTYGKGFQQLLAVYGFERDIYPLEGSVAVEAGATEAA